MLAAFPTQKKKQKCLPIILIVRYYFVKWQWNDITREKTVFSNLKHFKSIYNFLLLFSPSTFEELPWDQPSYGCKEYLAWKDNKYTTVTPWSKLDTLALSLIRKILTPNPEKRMTLDKIKLHKWCQSQLSTTGKIGLYGCACVGTPKGKGEVVKVILKLCWAFLRRCCCLFTLLLIRFS